MWGQQQQHAYPQQYGVQAGNPGYYDHQQQSASVHAMEAGHKADESGSGSAASRASSKVKILVTLGVVAAVALIGGVAVGVSTGGSDGDSTEEGVGVEDDVDSANQVTFGTEDRALWDSCSSTGQCQGGLWCSTKPKRDTMCRVLTDGSPLDDEGEERLTNDWMKKGHGGACTDASECQKELSCSADDDDVTLCRPLGEGTPTDKAGRRRHRINGISLRSKPISEVVSELQIWDSCTATSQCEEGLWCSTKTNRETLCRVINDGTALDSEATARLAADSRKKAAGGSCTFHGECRLSTSCATDSAGKKSCRPLGQGTPVDEAGERRHVLADIDIGSVPIGTPTTPTSPPSSGPPTGNARYASDVYPGLNLWKITLPVDEDGNDSSGVSDVDDRNSDAYEIKDDNLIDYENKPFFFAENNEMVFNAPCKGATTSGSKYPRSELRQRFQGGDGYWSVDDYQYLAATVRVTQLPVEKPEISMVQIHGPDDEPLRVQAVKGISGGAGPDSMAAFIVYNENFNTKDEPLPLEMGQRLRVKVTVNNGDITCEMENLETGGTFSKTWTSSDSTGYFKLGAYTQSSIFLSQFKDGKNDEPLDATGEVRVSDVQLVETPARD